MTTSSPLDAHIRTRGPEEFEETYRADQLPETDPADYAETLDALQQAVLSARFTIQRRANAEVIALYWRIGATVLERERTGAWDSAAVTRLAEDLERQFPTMRGFSPADLSAMRAFAAAWPERNGIVQQPVGQLPWAHVVQLLEKLDDQTLREWYAGKDVQYTWSSAELAHHLATRLHDMDDSTPQNFAAALAQPDSQLAQQLTDDADTTGFLAIRAHATGGAAEA